MDASKLALIPAEKIPFICPKYQKYIAVAIGGTGVASLFPKHRRCGNWTRMVGIKARRTPAATVASTGGVCGLLSGATERRWRREAKRGLRADPMGKRRLSASRLQGYALT